MRPPKPNHSYVLRSCDANMQSHGGFQWPMEGQVTCPDFQNNPECGNGLHGWLWGVGDYSASKYHANWLILEVADDDIIQISEKVKFPKCEVLFVGSLAKAYAWLKYAPHWEEAESSATGKYGHASATGKYGHASATGYSGHASATGKYGIAASVGFNGKAKASESGAIFISRGEYVKGNWKLTHVFASMVGQNDIKPDTWYTLDENGKPFEVVG